MSWQDDVMAEQEAADALEYMGEAEWRDTFEDRHGWAPDYDYDTKGDTDYELDLSDFWEKGEVKVKRLDKKKKV